MTHINAIRFMHFTTGACFINFFLGVWKKIYEISAWGPPTGHLIMTAEKRMEKKDIRTISTGSAARRSLCQDERTFFSLSLYLIMT